MSIVRAITGYGRSFADMLRGSPLHAFGVRVGEAITQLEERILDVQKLEAYVRATVPLSHTSFTTAGTFTYTAERGVKAVLFQGVGGGGGGGGCANAATNSAAGGGGGSGGYATKLALSPRGPFTLVVGAKGAGGTSGANAGTAGSLTSVSKDGVTILTGRGGAGGNGDSVATIHVGGFGGRGGGDSALGLGDNVGDFTCVGAPGAFGQALAAAQAVSGWGGSSVFGGGATARRNATGAGNAATGPGGGGSGAVIISGGASQAGGDGYQGAIVAWEFH